MKNKYVKRSRISETKFREIVKLFSLDLEAEQTAQIVNLSRNIINKYYKAFRQRIVELCKENSPFTGEIEVDESYFGANISIKITREMLIKIISPLHKHSLEKILKNI